MHPVDTPQALHLPEETIIPTSESDILGITIHAYFPFSFIFSLVRITIESPGSIV